MQELKAERDATREDGDRLETMHQKQNRLTAQVVPARTQTNAHKKDISGKGKLRNRSGKYWRTIERERGTETSIFRKERRNGERKKKYWTK
jgi:hypothetical protein